MCVCACVFVWYGLMPEINVHSFIHIALLPRTVRKMRVGLTFGFVHIATHSGQCGVVLTRLHYAGKTIYCVVTIVTTHHICSACILHFSSTKAQFIVFVFATTWASHNVLPLLMNGKWATVCPAGLYFLYQLGLIDFRQHRVNITLITVFARYTTMLYVERKQSVLFCWRLALLLLGRIAVHGIICGIAAYCYTHTRYSVIYLSVGYNIEPCKTAEPIGLPFGAVIARGQGTMY